jgi:hypothetical protein
LSIGAAVDVGAGEMDTAEATAEGPHLGRYARRVAIENPKMNDLARERMPTDLPPPQIVQPFWFGDPAYKATGLYLRGLPHLVATNMLPEPERGSDEWKRWNAVHRASPGPDRWKERSRTHPGPASAMAWQWGGDVREHGELFA